MAFGRKRIALLFGGRGQEHAVSVQSAEYVSGIIDREKYEIIPVFLDTGGGFSIKRGRKYTPTFPISLGRRRGLYAEGGVIPIDCAIPMLHGDFGEDGRIQGLLESAGIPYVGADTLCGAVASDKAFTRAVASSVGIPIARGKALSRRATDGEIIRAAGELGDRVFIKPTRLGSSIGASPAEGEGQILDAFHRAGEYGCDVLIEELISPKREVEIGVLATRDGVLLSPIGEVMCGGFYDYGRKYHAGTRTLTNAELDRASATKIEEHASALVGAIGLRGPARVDFFLSGGRILLNEINTMPGFTADSLYPRLMRAAGIEPGELFDILIEDATECGE